MSSSETTTKDWKLYQAGLTYNEQKDIIKTAKLNTDFYEGNQWIGAKDTNLPKPTMNVLKRVGSYDIASLTEKPIKAYMSPLMFENYDKQKMLDLIGQENNEDVFKSNKYEIYGSKIH